MNPSFNFFGLHRTSAYRRNPHEFAGYLAGWLISKLIMKLLGRKKKIYFWRMERHVIVLHLTCSSLGCIRCVTGSEEDALAEDNGSVINEACLLNKLLYLYLVICAEHSAACVSLCANYLVVAMHRRDHLGGPASNQSVLNGSNLPKKEKKNCWLCSWQQEIRVLPFVAEWLHSCLHTIKGQKYPCCNPLMRIPLTERIGAHKNRNNCFLAVKNDPHFCGRSDWYSFTDNRLHLVSAEIECWLDLAPAG